MTFQEDEVILKKELFDGMYSIEAYYVAKQIVVFPVTAFWSVVYNSIVLACTQVSPLPVNAFYIVLTCMLVQFTFQSAGLLISIGIPDSSIVTTAVVVVTYLFAFPGMGDDFLFCLLACSLKTNWNLYEF